MRTEIKVILQEDRFVFSHWGGELEGSPSGIVMLLGALFGSAINGMMEGETLTIYIEKQ